MIYCCNASRKDLINVHLFMVPIAYSYPQSVRILVLHATVLVLLAAISISITPSPHRLVAVVCMVPVSVVPILIIMRSLPPVPVVVGACHQLLAPTIHPASSGSQCWGWVLGHPSSTLHSPICPCGLRADYAESVWSLYRLLVL
jgi:hypothetical protein